MNSFFRSSDGDGSSGRTISFSDPNVNRHVCLLHENSPSCTLVIFLNVYFSYKPK